MSNASDHSSTLSPDMYDPRISKIKEGYSNIYKIIVWNCRFSTHPRFCFVHVKPLAPDTLLLQQMRMYYPLSFRLYNWRLAFAFRNILVNYIVSTRRLYLVSLILPFVLKHQAFLLKWQVNQQNKLFDNVINEAISHAIILIPMVGNCQNGP